MINAWLGDWPWETVTAINLALCKEKNAAHKPTSDGYEQARKLWEDSRHSRMALRQAHAHAFRSVVGHYIAGTVGDEELEKALAELERHTK